MKIKGRWEVAKKILAKQKVLRVASIPQAEDRMKILVHRLVLQAKENSARADSFIKNPEVGILTSGFFFMNITMR